MAIGLLGKKLGMSQVYNDQGDLVPVTLIEAGPCDILQIKSEQNDGYSAIQMGFGDKKEKSSTKAEIGHCKKAKMAPKRFIKELRVGVEDQFELGQKLTVGIFEGVDKLDISGTSKGKGFAGVMKRWGFRGGPATHGSTRHRGSGSVGAGTDPGRVLKGRKMSGRMGGARTTVRNIEVVKVDEGNNLICVKGAVPGPKGGFVTLRICK
ncbi:MAG: 50S ribosomal protein L3 [Planctomycetes bacterium]|nr:50S ribosomal protein L3 [Planctomycetota bacterium]